jgi:hypothetical protein
MTLLLLTEATGDGNERRSSAARRLGGVALAPVVVIALSDLAEIAGRHEPIEGKAVHLLPAKAGGLGFRERGKMDDQFIEAPAQTLEDIGTKLEFLTVMADLKVGPDADVSDRMVFSLIRDIERMTGTKILR